MSDKLQAETKIPSVTLICHFQSKRHQPGNLRSFLTSQLKGNPDMKISASNDENHQDSVTNQDEGNMKSTCLKEDRMINQTSDDPSSEQSSSCEISHGQFFQTTKCLSLSSSSGNKYQFTFEPLKISLESDDSCDESSWSEHSSDIEMYEEKDISYFHKKSSREICHDLHYTHVTSVCRDFNGPSPSGLHLPLQSAPFLQNHSVSMGHIEISLRENKEVPITPISSSCSSSHSPNKKAKIDPKNKKRVSVNKNVTVVSIPSRMEYPYETKQKLWSSSAELYANAARNTVEFASEGWNWRSVLEEEHMLVHQGNGEFIHPIHLQNVLASISQADNTDEQRQLIASLVPSSTIFSDKHSDTTTNAPSSPTTNIITTSANTTTPILPLTNECPAA